MGNLQSELYRQSKKYYGGGETYYPPERKTTVMSERMLIKEICTGKTKAGKAVGHLFANGRQMYPELVLFDLSDLQTVGIEPDTLTDSREPCRFWAHYSISDKTTSEGNPYRDILHLEPIDAPASTTSTDTSAMLDVLREMVDQLTVITGLLMPVAEAIINPAQIPAPDPDPYPAGSPTSDDPDPAAAEYPAVAAILAKQRSSQASSNPGPSNGDQTAFYELAATAQADGLSATVIDDIIAAVAADHGFVLARECLAAEIARSTGKSLDHRHAVIDRLTEILAHTLVVTGQVTHDLVPGWQWTFGKAALLRTGKQLAAAIEEADPQT